ncbi:MAG: hypothetical protein WC238_05675 [Parcubacteria group bacterium]
MNVKKALVSFLTIATVLFLAATASAYTITGTLASNIDVSINDISAAASTVSVNAGETITVRLEFTSSVDASDVKVRLELGDTTVKSDLFDVENGATYTKTLTIKVPYDLENEVSNQMTLDVENLNDDYKSETSGLAILVQRPSYNANILSVQTDSSIQAGALIPVDVVIRNNGYNELKDLFVTAKIETLNLEKTAYFGDLVSIENTSSDEDETDTVSGRLYLRIPYGVQAGAYALKVEVSDGHGVVASETKQLEIGNNFPQQVVKTSTGLLFVNPTNELQVYRIVLPNGENIVTVPAGSSKTLDVSATSENYPVSVLTLSGSAVASFTFSPSAQNAEFSSPVVVFTVILGIIFLVLLVVLIVLITRRPKKTEEFGESYY